MLDTFVVRMSRGTFVGHGMNWEENCRNTSFVTLGQIVETHVV